MTSMQLSKPTVSQESIYFSLVFRHLFYNFSHFLSDAYDFAFHIHLKKKAIKIEFGHPSSNKL